MTRGVATPVIRRLDTPPVIGAGRARTPVATKVVDQPGNDPLVGVGRPTQGRSVDHSYDDMLKQVDLGKKREKLTKKSHYVKLMDEYVSLAQLRAAQIRKAADTLGYDYVSLRDLRVEAASMASTSPKAKHAKERARFSTAYKMIVNEHMTGTRPGSNSDAAPGFDVDWDKAIGDSAVWATRAQSARDQVEEDRINVEMLWDEVKSDPSEGPQVGAKQAAEAKTSLNHIEVVRQQLKGRVDYLTKKARVQGAGGKIVDAVVAGGASFLTTLVTLGVVAVEKEFNPLFYKGAGWSHHSDMPGDFDGRGKYLEGAKTMGADEKAQKLPVSTREERAYNLVVMENLGGKIKQVKNMLGQRKGGANTLDWLSGILWFIGDGVLQSLMAVGSRIAIWVTALNLLLNLINVPAHGALTPVIAVLTAMALAITYVRMALSAAKVAVTAARAAVDGLNYAVTKDPRMRQALKGRAIRSGVGLAGDTMQLGGFAVVLGGDVIKEGLGMAHAFQGANNAFNPISDLHNVAQVHSDVLSHANEVSSTSGTFWEGEAIFFGGVGGVLLGADAVPAIGEAVSDSNDLNSQGGTPYLGGSNQKSQGWEHHGMGHDDHDDRAGHQGAGTGRTPQRPGGARPGRPVPTWMAEGKQREEQMVGERAAYLEREAGKKVGVSQSAMQTPIQTVGAVAEKSEKVSGMLDKVKAFFKGESKKKKPDVPKDQIAEQAQEADSTQQDAGGFAKALTESASAMADFGGT
ncbi:MAG TPA: hypothetical protein VFP61_09340 [Acidimicrobiales bacterium]|nr:hypothetical protein [Acidimicrobiales bacterium]